MNDQAGPESDLDEAEDQGGRNQGYLQELVEVTDSLKSQACKEISQTEWCLIYLEHRQKPQIAQKVEKAW